jgi:hypothetical protein
VSAVEIVGYSLTLSFEPQAAYSLSRCGNSQVADASFGVLHDFDLSERLAQRSMWQMYVR